MVGARCVVVCSVVFCLCGRVVFNVFIVWCVVLCVLLCVSV